jgi:hypothetical protein
MKALELYGRVRYAVQIEGLSRREASLLDPHSVEGRGGHAGLYAIGRAPPGYGAAAEPPSWPEAYRRLLAEGRRSRVSHPSEPQRRFEIRGPRKL